MRTSAPAPQPSVLSIRREDAGRLPVFVVTGAIDALGAPHLSAAICAYGGEKVVVDLSGVQRMDATGLRDLLLAARVLSIALHVVRPRRGPVRRLVDAGGAIATLHLHDSRHDALTKD